MHFGQIPRVPGDPILGLMDLYRADTNPAKLDLGVGVYKDAQGLTPIPRAVKLAEQRLVDSEQTKSYIGGHGDAQFGALLLRQVLGSRAIALGEQRAGCTQAPGGTGALRLAGEFIAKCLPGRSIWLSDPTWPIHETLFAAAGLRVQHYPYVGADNRLDVDGMLAALQQVPAGDVVLLHACCHNPTGFDLDHDDWLRVLEVVRARELLPLFDFAYQGFGDGLEEDAWAVRLFAETLPEMLITSSCSKNFGLYRERTGALIAVTSDAERLLNVRSQLASLARNLWSTPPSHGAAVVATILGDEPLRQIWQDEVERMRRRIASLRAGLVEALTPYGLAERFAHIAQQRGMFSYTGLTAEQVRRLRAEDSVYLVESGRANVAGLDAERLDALAKAIARVVSS
ncbi:aromatic amino acid aminotransferase [Stutzerimonas stutzeri]|uniref:amino acid aminotransferase n=1 Tax=Stutzerimonas stutzeri subgroup TaxID=578833 RepID=UPI000C6D1E81|nr:MULTISPECIES: amino acid aminotransferase [Stutzerimonas stutzeri subgroup]MCQ2045377.1 aspartate/tyrosine/aromatic aminotransferase [Stutzerimonas kunmingensis]PKR27293.1 aromatic amino acid aminotransferase [Stutzerimonas stutzeri]QQC10939.1 aspartate/tyrosine/aromatic aminotransferase [Stutzerimonas stutzeri]VEI31310.1 aromatic amino acid aminotransferase [Stutzerimonas stutzeri]